MANEDRTLMATRLTVGYAPSADMATVEYATGEGWRPHATAISMRGATQGPDRYRLDVDGVGLTVEHRDSSLRIVDGEEYAAFVLHTLGLPPDPTALQAVLMEGVPSRAAVRGLLLGTCLRIVTEDAEAHRRGDKNPMETACGIVSRNLEGATS